MRRTVSNNGKTRQAHGRPRSAGSRAVARAYEIIGDATPIKADCGRLCGAACCKGYADGESVGSDTISADVPAVTTDDSTVTTDVMAVTTDDSAVTTDVPLGMFLFPGEYELLSGEPGYRFFKVPYMGGLAWFMVCEGFCDRRRRPLACRMFPLAPHINDGGAAEALPDPRANRMCPLAGGEFLDPEFRAAAAKAFRYLAREPEIFEYMKLLSADLDEIRQFVKFLNK